MTSCLQRYFPEFVNRTLNVSFVVWVEKQPSALPTPASGIDIWRRPGLTVLGCVLGGGLLLFLGGSALSCRGGKVWGLQPSITSSTPQQVNLERYVNLPQENGT